MIDNFLGIDTEGGAGYYGVCHIMRHAVMILFLIFIKDRSSLQYFLTPGMGLRVLCSLHFALYVILGGGLMLWVGWEEGKEESQGGTIPVYYEACLKTQPAHKPLIHHDEKHDFFFHLINSATMEINVYTSVWSIAIDILSYRQMLRVQQ